MLQRSPGRRALWLQRSPGVVAGEMAMDLGDIHSRHGASTEPRRCRRGDAEVLAQCQAAIWLQRSPGVVAGEIRSVTWAPPWTNTGFNGAPALSPGRLPYIAVSGTAVVALQRSPGVVAGEMLGDGGRVGLVWRLQRSPGVV